METIAGQGFSLPSAVAFKSRGWRYSPPSRDEEQPQPDERCNADSDSERGAPRTIALGARTLDIRQGKSNARLPFSIGIPVQRVALDPWVMDHLDMPALSQNLYFLWAAFWISVLDERNVLPGVAAGGDQYQNASVKRPR